MVDAMLLLKGGGGEGGAEGVRKWRFFGGAEGPPLGAILAKFGVGFCGPLISYVTTLRTLSNHHLLNAFAYIHRMERSRHVH